MSKFGKVASRNEALARSVQERIAGGEKPQDALAKSLASFGLSKGSYNHYRKLLSKQYRVEVPKKRPGRPRGLKGPEWCRNTDRDQAIVLAYKAGNSAMQILAREQNLSCSRVHQILVAAGINAREFRKTWIDPSLKKDVQAGMPVERIMRKHGVPDYAVRKAYRKLGLPLPRPQFRIQQDARRKAMIAAYQAGEPVEMIAAVYGMKVLSVRARMAGWKARRPKRK